MSSSDPRRPLWRGGPYPASITLRHDPEGVAQVIAQSEHWTLIHLVIILGTILMLAGLIAIRHSILSVEVDP